MSIAEAAALAGKATDGILAALGTAERGVVVDSPPGAGKSTLVVRASRVLADAGERVMVLGQTNEQVDDLIARLAGQREDLLIGRLCASAYVRSDRVTRPNVKLGTSVADLGDCAVVLGTAAKWATVTEADAQVWPWAIVDEAYQMRSDLLLQVAGLFQRALFVGDPGQLDPFSIVETERWTGLSWDPMNSAVSVMLAHNAHVVPVHTLPVSWRLPATAAPVVSEAFYPFTGFTSATERGDRSLEWKTGAFGSASAFDSAGLPVTPPIDRALEEAAATGWALYELPARHTLRTDREAVAACASLAARALERGAVVTAENGTEEVTADRIAIGTAHRDQAAAVRAALAQRGVSDVVVDTANRLQGREFELTIVLHPLSGRRDATAFHLETGRLCVLASRHRQACVVVARAGIPALLDAHPSAEPVHLGVPVKFPDGWEAHQAILAHLAKHRVTAGLCSRFLLLEQQKSRTLSSLDLSGWRTLRGARPAAGDAGAHADVVQRAGDDGDADGRVAAAAEAERGIRVIPPLSGRRRADAKPEEDDDGPPRHVLHSSWPGATATTTYLMFSKRAVCDTPERRKFT